MNTFNTFIIDSFASLIEEWFAGPHKRPWETSYIDSSIIMADSKSFAQEIKYLGVFFYFIIKLYVVRTH